MDTTTDTTYTIEQYYDRAERSWVTMIVDAVTLHQAGDALYDGTKADAAASKSYLAEKIADGTVEAWADR